MDTSDVLYLTAADPDKNELFTWSFELNSPAFFVERILKTLNTTNVDVLKSETDTEISLSASGVEAKFNKKTGLLKEIVSNDRIIPLSDGPIFITDQQLDCKNVSVKSVNGTYQIDVLYAYPRGNTAYRFIWTMQKSGILQLDYDYRPMDKTAMCGITFSFPEKDISGAKLFANGPYRVYNNRLKGGTLNIREKTYNDAITGEVWDYPEFKGYYSLFYGMRLLCNTPFEVYSGSEDLFLHLFTPTIQQNYDAKRNFTFPPYPAGNISFLDAIPAVGTKFDPAENYGPQSQPHTFKVFSETPNMTNRLYFKFN